LYEIDEKLFSLVEEPRFYIPKNILPEEIKLPRRYKDP